MWQLLSVNHVFAAQWGIISKEKAPVYSDIEMMSVIGHLPKGKKIRVGDVPKNKGRLLPIIVNKKVAYVEVRFIEFGNDPSLLGTASNRIKEKFTQKTIVRHIGFYTGSFYGVLSNQGEKESDDILFVEYGLRGYYMNTLTGRNIRVSFGEGRSTGDTVRFKYLPLAASFKLFGLQSYGKSLIFYLGPVFAPYAELEAVDLFKITGQGYGGEFGAELRYELGKNINLHVDANYQSIKFQGLDLSDNGSYDSNYDTFVNGLKVLGTISYSY